MCGCVACSNGIAEACQFLGQRWKPTTYGKDVPPPPPFNEVFKTVVEKVFNHCEGARGMSEPKVSLSITGKELVEMSGGAIEPKYKVGEKVYFIRHDEICSSIVKQHFLGLSDGTIYFLEIERDSGLFCVGILEKDLFPTKAALLEHITKQIEELE